MPSPVLGLPHTRAALAYAERVHRGQRRKVDGAPFILHPLEVASLLYHAGAPDHVVAAGVLHDAVEKSHVCEAELQERFGPEVARLVLAVSEDESIVPYTERKAALRRQAAEAGAEALMVMAADKVSKVRELSLSAAEESTARPGGPQLRTRGDRVAHYADCLRLLKDRLPHSPLAHTLEAELQSLSRSGAAGSPLAARL